MADDDADREHVARVLGDFAAHTRHSEREASDTSMMARKWLALHIKSAPAPLVYTRIAHDYDLVAARTYEPPLAEASGSVPDPRTFVYIMKHGYPRRVPIAGHEFGAFRDALFPKHADHEVCMDYLRDTHWRERAYYMAAQCGAPYSLVQAIESSGQANPMTRECKDAAADMHELLTRYMRLHPQHALGNAESIGALVAQIELEPLECSACDNTTTTAKSDDENEAVDAAAAAAATPLLAFAAADPNASDGGGGAAIDCTAYRKRMLLPPAYPTDKLVKHMFMARIGAAGAAGGDAVHDAAWSAIKARVRIPDVGSLSASPALRELHAGLRWRGTATAFVHAALDVYAKRDDTELTPFERKYKQKYPQCDETITKAAF